jgi:hypothetical protein
MEQNRLGKACRLRDHQSSLWPANFGEPSAARGPWRTNQNQTTLEYWHHKPTTSNAEINTIARLLNSQSRIASNKATIEDFMRATVWRRNIGSLLPRARGGWSRVFSSLRGRECTDCKYRLDLCVHLRQAVTSNLFCWLLLAHLMNRSVLGGYPYRHLTGLAPWR